MKAKDFLKLVSRMLTAQQNYFRNRLQGDLVQAKQLEREVAAVVKIGKLEPDDPQPTATQATLFGSSPLDVAMELAKEAEGQRKARLLKTLDEVPANNDIWIYLNLFFSDYIEIERRQQRGQP
jgi:hypothetical protein